MLDSTDLVTSSTSNGREGRVISTYSYCQQSTFPDNKLPEVISFCKTEVIAHLIDNLIGNAEAVISKRCVPSTIL